MNPSAFLWTWKGKTFEELSCEEAVEALRQMVADSETGRIRWEASISSENERLRRENERLWRVCGGIV